MFLLIMSDVSGKQEKLRAPEPYCLQSFTSLFLLLLVFLVLRKSVMHPEEITFYNASCDFILNIISHLKKEIKKKKKSDGRRANHVIFCI